MTEPLLFRKVWLVLAVAGMSLGHAEVLLSTNATWAYRKGTGEASTPTNAWRTLAFSDLNWARGAAPFFYDTDGGYRGNTELPDMRNGYTSLYLRRTFVIEDASEVSSMLLRFLCDDGFALWVNGILVTNHNKTGNDFAFGTTATAGATEPLVWLSHTLSRPQSYLRPGTNLVAVQALNRPITSSDFLFEMELTAIRPDTRPPTIQAVHPPPGVITNLTHITITFSEPVTGLGFSDLLINDRPAVDLAGAGAEYVFAVETPAEGNVAIRWDAGAEILDLATPPNRFDTAAPATTWGYELVDRTAPVMAVVTPPAGNTVTRLDQVEVRFSEAVDGVDATDLLINGVPATTVSGSNAGPYLFGFSPQPRGRVEVRWRSDHGIRDQAAQPNGLVAAPWTYEIDPDFRFAPVRISEFLADYSGSAGLADEDEELSDWIELENRGTNSVNLRGWSLTDDEDDPGKWVFPDIVLKPSQFLVVFASGKDRRPAAAGAPFHTNFKLSMAGEYLALFTPDVPRQGSSVFAPGYPEQRSDHSYGWDAADTLRYFNQPSPGRANGPSSITGVVPPVTPTVERGCFDAPFELGLACALADVEIRFTTDGSVPSLTNGVPYAKPLVVSNTTILRAAAFKQRQLPSRVMTQTYVFLDQVIRQPAWPAGLPTTWIDTQNRTWTADYEMDPEITGDPAYRDVMKDALRSLPIVSLVTRPEDMFDNARGIYPKSQARGPTWERPASVEFLFPGATAETEETFQIDCGVQCQGNSVRDPVKTGKHAFRLVFKGDYGATKLRYRVFPESPVSEFDTLTLRADFNNSWMHWNHLQRPRGQRVRDAFMKDSQRAMSGFSAHNRFFHLYVNGLYWGVYDPVERPDAAFAASYLGGRKEDYDVVNEGQLVDGDMTAYREMVGLTNLGDPAAYEAMKRLLDVPHYIDYVLLHFYVGHEDWGQDKNWYTVRRRAPGAGFKYIAWDGELMMNSPTQNRVTNPDTASGLHGRLMASPEYRLAFADRVQKHCFQDGALTPAVVAARYARRVDQVDLAMVAESARWGDYRRDVHSYSSGPYELYTRDGHFRTERQRLLTQYVPTRSGILVDQLRAAGLFPTRAVAPTLSQSGGWGRPGMGVTLTAPTGRIYYTLDGQDPREPYSGAVRAAARLYERPITLETSAILKARSLDGSEWSPLSEAAFQIGQAGVPLRLTEIMYRPEGGEPYEFIEFQNAGPLPLDVGGFSLKGVSFVFPSGTVLEPGKRVVVASALAPEAFAVRYRGVAVLGYFDGALANDGERLSVLDREFRTIVSVDYRDRDGWPAAADDRGHSLEIIDPLGDPDAPANWQASGAPGGTPGQPPAPRGTFPVRLNEVSAAPTSETSPTAGGPDFIELHNTSANTVDLAGWSFTDSNDAHRFVFPSGTRIEAGAYLVVWCGVTHSEMGLHAPFGLAVDGDSVLLYDAEQQRVDALTWGPQIADASLGWDAEKNVWCLGRATPGAANASVRVVSAEALAINEWLAASGPDPMDWIELFNRDSLTPAELTGCYLATSNALYRFRSPAFVAPRGYLRLWADEAPGGDHVDFRLPAEGGAIRLLDTEGAMVNQVRYGQQTLGVAEGRLPDGATRIVSFPRTPTPGRPNTDRVEPSFAGIAFDLDRLRLTVQGDLVPGYALQVSTDLKQWRALLSTNPTSMPFVWDIPWPPTERAAFFRVQIMP